MPDGKTGARLKGEVLGTDARLRASTLAAMPGPPPAMDRDEHPRVTINGTVYAWEPGDEAGVPPEALAVWARSLEAHG